jgi:hypothetical protein
MAEKRVARWFLDTEFHEDGKTIDLISVAIVSEGGEEHAWVSSEFDEERCSDWVKANVLPHLPDRATWAPRATIATELARVVLASGEKPQFWGYFADYDWVAIAQLYGRMIDLPDGFPFFCFDLKQSMVTMGVTKAMLPEQSGVEHSAIEDARWIREAWLYLKDWEERERRRKP